MAKVAFIFPGQGAQYPGMGRDIYDSYPEYKELVDRTDELLGIKLSETVFNGSKEELSKTEITQPAILMTSVGIMNILVSKGVSPSVVAGLSLGEYSALVSSGAIAYDEAVELVRKRGLYMEQAASDGSGTMAAILGLDLGTLKEIVEPLKSKGIIDIANYNCPGQLVISGEVDLVREASEKAKGAGAKRAVELDVSGPFHTDILKPAGDRLYEDLKASKIDSPCVEIYFNVSANKEREREAIVDSLRNQVSNSVLWEDIVDRMITEDGITDFVEIGPGKTLSSFVKKINKKHKKEINLYNIEDLESLNDFLEAYIL